MILRGVVSYFFFYEGGGVANNMACGSERVRKKDKTNHDIWLSCNPVSSLLSGMPAPFAISLFFFSVQRKKRKKKKRRAQTNHAHPKKKERKLHRHIIMYLVRDRSRTLYSCCPFCPIQLRKSRVLTEARMSLLADLECEDTLVV